MHDYLILLLRINHLPRIHVNLFITGIVLLFSLILSTPSARADNTYTYEYTFNGSSLTPTSSTSPEPQVDEPTATDTADDTTVDNPAPSTGESTDQADTTEASDGNVTEAAPDTGTETAPASNSIPVASPDSISTAQDTPVDIEILANDSGLNDTPLTLSILALPTHGQVIVESDNSITYIPDDGYTGTDSMIYKVMDNNGDSAIADTSIEVQCGACPADILLTLTWNPNPGEIWGYAVYFGPSAEGAIQLASELPMASGLLNPESPRVQYYLGGDLGLAQGDNVCFRLKAYNESGYSEYSAAACLDSVI